jgi:hypothetical protein
MRNLEQISLRLYFLVFMFLNKILLWAQDDDDDIFGSSSHSRDMDPFDAEGLMEYQPIRFRMSDIITVVLLLIACYVFGKIWKGCSYLLLAFAALMYYLLRF